MTETFLDRQQVRTLATDCKIIADSSGELLRIARRETSPPGGRAARNPRTPGSRPPVNLSALSVAGEIHTCLAGWARNLRDNTGIGVPELDDRSLALHLRVHAHRIAQQDWAVDCANEIATWAATILALTTPPPGKRLDDYTQAQRAEGIATAKVSAVMCADLVEEYTKGEHTPTADKIREWGRRGVIDAYGPKSSRVYSVAQVLHHVRLAGRARLDR